MNPQKTAIIYVRWSTLEQSDTDSYTRQINATTKFCADNGLTVLETVIDKGRSAWTGENIYTGNMAKLVERFKRREFPDDTVIVVEQLDRLTRLPPMDVIGWLTTVAFPAGVEFQTSVQPTRISKQEMTTNQVGMISFVFDSFRGHGESQRKSDMGLSSWDKRRKAVEAGERKNITGVCPAWMRWDKEKEDFVLITHPTNWRLDRKKIIQRIFNQADDGVGYVMIARKLNEDMVPAWGLGKRASDGWHTSYIHKILRNTAVIGEFQPQSRRKGMLKGVAVGEPIPDYYPQVIAPAQFERVASRRAKVNVGGASKGGRKNLLAGLVYCGKCNARMNFGAKGNAGRERTNPKTGTVTVDKSDSIYLRCSGSLRGHRCNEKNGFNYVWLQNALLDNILHLALDDAHFQHSERVAELEDQIAAGKRELARLEQQAEAALDMTLDPAFKHDARIKDRYRQASQGANDQRTHLDELGIALTKAKGSVSPVEHVSRVKAVRTAIDSAEELERDAARVKVMDALQAIINKIVFMPDRTIEVSAVHGAVNFQFDDRGNLLKKVDLVPFMKRDANLKAGLMKRNGIVPADIASDIARTKTRQRRAR